MLSDQTAKVQFEIRNMFKVINRLTTNEITIFSPILTQKKFSKSIQKSFLSAKKLSEAMRAIMKVDYSLFHREQMYYDPENKIDNIVVMKQVLPDFILMPNVGSRGVMWQDISEKMKQLEREKTQIEQEVKVFMDGCGEANSEHYRVVWQEIASERLDIKRLKQEKPEIYREYVQSRKSSRFTVKVA